VAGRLKGKLLTNQTTVIVDITITITLIRAAEQVATRCRHRGGIADPRCNNACRALGQPIGDPIRYFVTRAKSSKTSQLAVSRRSTGIDFDTSESYYRSYNVATSCVNRCANWICHNRLSRKKLQENLLHMISTEVSSLATHNISSSVDAIFTWMKCSYYL
jgi:hypothetical protein